MTYFPGLYLLYSYAGVKVTGVVVIIGLDTCLWIFLVWVVILFLSCCLLFVFSENFDWALPLLLTCMAGMFNQECVLLLKAGISGGQEDMIVATHHET